MRVEAKIPKQEFLSCVDHQFCFCKDCVILDGRAAQKADGKCEATQDSADLHKVSCGSMVSFENSTVLALGMEASLTLSEGFYR